MRGREYEDGSARGDGASEGTAHEEGPPERPCPRFVAQRTGRRRGDDDARAELGCDFWRDNVGNRHLHVEAAGFELAPEPNHLVEHVATTPAQRALEDVE